MFYGSSQTYFPTGTDSTTYSVNCTSTMHYPIIDYSVYQITFRGDTLINGKSYIKAYEKYYMIDTSFDIYSSLYGYNYIFAVRDSVKKVFTIKSNDSIERLVYDFNLSIGDTMQHYLSYFDVSDGISILNRIDSILVK